ncbi:MAG: hypothetical protein AAGH43_07540 [Pseudomonadota bacterium]
MDRDAWTAKVSRFNSALAALEDDRRFEKLRNGYCIRFDRHIFDDGDKDFTRFEFPCSVSFHGCHFGDGDVDFRSSTFADGDVDLSWATFGEGAVILSHISFGDGGFFCIGTDFGSQSVSFYRSTFGKGVRTFSGVKLQDGYFDFPLTEFGSGDFHFVDAKLRSAFVRFYGAKFGQGHVRFEGSQIEAGALLFRSLHVRGRLDCRWLTVGTADFSELVVDDVADWTDAKFGSIPDFRQMKLDRAPEVARMRVPEPDLVHIISEIEQKKRALPKRDFWQLVAADGQDVLKLRKLKAMAIAANDHEKDGEFFAYEMMAKRGTEHTTFWQLLANTIYWKVSFYGQSYLRPLAWMFGNFGFFAALYTLMAVLPIGGWNSLWFGTTYSFKNSLPFLGTITRSVPSLDGHTSWFAKQLGKFEGVQPGLDWLTVLGTGQAILSLIFFFFLLLGLRNRFRLK